MGWALLERQEKRQAWAVLVVVVLSALSASVMVASIMPFLSVLSDPDQIRTNAFLQRAYQWGGFETDRGFLLALGLASIGVIVIANLIQVVRLYVVTRYTLMRAHTISARLLSSYLHQPYAFFLENHSGEMGTKVLSESQQVVTQFFRPAGEAVASLLTLAAVLGLLLYVDPLISLIVFAIFGGAYGGTLLMTRRIVQRLGAERAKNNSLRFRIAAEALGNVRDIKLLGREWSYLDRFQTPSLKMNTGMAKVAFIEQVPKYVMQAMVFCGLIIICLVLLAQAPARSSQQAVAQILPTIGLLAFAGQRMLPELSRLFASVTKLTYGDAAVRTVHDALATEGTMQALPRKREAPLSFMHELAFEAVGHRYPRGEKVSLSDINFRISVGERIGIVGTTGAGKSTLANILLGLISPTEGRFVVDGKAITPENIRSWQRNLGYVPQEISLVDASVRENIALGVPPDEIDHARVEQAARTAQIHDFIMTELNNGYDTETGERGMRLSGGQRQRIGIARALYNDGDLLILDEATSALDNITEAEVMAAIDTLPSDKTVIMIAHRLNSLKSCDRIIFLHEGRISAIGAWNALMAMEPRFRELVELERKSA